MRFGLCTGINNLKKMEDAGYDYIECRGDRVAAMTEEEFSVMQQVLVNSSLQCEALNFFLPPELKVVGPNVNEKEIAECIEKSVARAIALGVKVIVVGSGKSRMVPEGWSKEKATIQFGAVLKTIGQKTAKEKITIVIEAIRSSSTNLINNLKQAAELCEMVAEPNVYIMADYNQMVGDHENMDQIIQYGRLIKHFHVIDTNNSYFPLDLNHTGHKEFFAAIKQIGFQDRISVEIHDFDSVPDAKKSLVVLKTFVSN